MIALGVVVCLVLAAGFFCLGSFCIAPMLKNHLNPPPKANQPVAVHQTVPSPPVEQPAEAPTDTAGKADTSLDVQVTEEGQDQTTGDQASGSDNGVKQDSSGLTVTLEPNDQQKSGQTTSSTEETAKPSETAVPKTQVEKPEPQPVHENSSMGHSSSSQSGRSRYRVQAGTFASKSNADALAKDLRAHGYKPEVRTVQGEAGTLYRVEVGDYRSRQGAQDMADELSGKGYSPSVTTSH